MTGAVLSALFAFWRRNPLQAFALVSGLALATALWSGVQAINAEARASYDAAAATLGEGTFAQIVATDGGPIRQADYIALRRAGWLVAPVVEGRLRGVRVVGLDPLTAPGGLGPVSVGDVEVTDFLGNGLVFGQPDALTKLDADGPRPVTSPDVAPGTVITDIGIAQDLLGFEGFLSRLIVAPEQPLGQIALADIADDLSLRAPQQGNDLDRLTDSFHLNLTAFGMLSFAVGLFIVHGAIGLVFEQRRPMVRTLRALGVPLQRLVMVIGLELCLIALMAGGIGVALGYLIAAALLPDVAATLHGLYGATVAGTLTIRPAWWVSGLGIAIGGTALAAAGALWQVARMPLLASARPRAWALAGMATRRWQLLGGVALLLFAFGTALFGSGLTAGFTLLAALLQGAALLLPPLLDFGLAIGARVLSGTPIRDWFWADTRQQLPGLSLALMALLLAMAANVGVSTMVSSFRLTFTGFLDQRLSSELYINTEDSAQAAAVTAFLDGTVDAILPVIWVERDLAGLPSELYGARDHATYRDNWRFLSAADAPWDAVASGTGVIINEQLSRRAGLAVGDRLSIAPGETRPVVGVYGDYGNPIGQAVIGLPLFQALYPDATALRFGLRMPAADVPEVRQALREFGIPDGQMIDQARIKAFSLGVFERTFAVTGALNVLTLAVAAFAILMSLLTLAALRVPQLAPVWALGLTRLELGRIEVLRAVLLAVLTTSLALPLGLALAWVLLAVVNVEAFGWRLPMYLFPLDYLRLTVFALLAAFLAALWPSVRLARTPPADLLKVFSGDR